MSRIDHGIGVDCTETARWRKLVRSGRQERLFTKKEHAQCEGSAVKYARCWCAKEAVFKAMSPHAPADLRKIEVLMDRNGQPKTISIDGKYGRTQIKVSLSHTPGAAMAVAIATTTGR